MWSIDRCDVCADWIRGLHLDAKEAIYKSLLILRTVGPSLGRPYVDAVAGGRYPNMKELRVQNRQRLFRVLFAFDPKRVAVLLAGGYRRGDKSFASSLTARSFRSPFWVSSRTASTLAQMLVRNMLLCPASAASMSRMYSSPK